MFVRIFVAAAVLFVAAPSFAQERMALVIANGAYDGEALPAVASASTDAEMVAEALEQAAFEVTRADDVDLRDLKVAVRDFADAVEAAGEETIALVYFTGQGFAAEGQNYIAPIGADLRDKSDAEFEALAVEWVLSRLARAHDGPNLLVLDAARPNALSSGNEAGFVLMGETPQNALVAFANTPGSVAPDDGGESPFASAFAAEAVVPGQTADEVFANTRDGVAAQSEGAMVPFVQSALADDVILAPQTMFGLSGLTQTEEAADLSPEVEAWTAVKDSEDAGALKTFINSYPEGAYTALARSRLDETTGAVQDITTRFALLQEQSEVVSAPQRAHEFYANARLHELRGENQEARQNYLKYLAFDPPYVDPHLRFQRFLQGQDGIEAAREVYRSLSAGSNAIATRFAAALLEPEEARTAALEALLEDAPDFAPALHALSEDHSAARLGAQASADKIAEGRLLEAFKARLDAGDVRPYYIDQQAAADVIEDVETRLAALSTVNLDALASPVHINAMRSNQGWTVSFNIADQVREIFTGPEGGELASTGFMPGIVNPQTGEALPRQFIEVDPDAEAHTIMVAYTDIRGERRGPFPVLFDPHSALRDGQKQILLQLTNAWISTRDWDGRMLIYFTHLISYRCAIDTVAFSYDGDDLDRTYELAPCNPDDPHVVETASGVDSDIFQTVPSGATSVSVQLTFKDGTVSDVKRFAIK
ncbi:MAG: caspase family protein [Pseudomonadota bacterium]